MKHFKTLMMAVFTILSASVFSQQGADTTPSMITHGTAAAIYECPMHPKVTSNTAGKCSQCNMDLKLVITSPFYSCPMHPGVTSDQPVKCNSCGMDLVTSSRQKANRMKKYACLMHPEETSNKPGACVKCKLTLKENKSR